MFVSRNCYEALLSLKWSTTVTDIQQRRYFFWQHLHVNKEIQPNFLFIEKNKKIVQKCIIDLFWKASKNFEGGERQPERTEILWKGRWKIIPQNYWSKLVIKISDQNYWSKLLIIIQFSNVKQADRTGLLSQWASRFIMMCLFVQKCMKKDENGNLKRNKREKRLISLPKYAYLLKKKLYYFCNF